ncbi:E3 ubiquitin-protein ligase MARCH8-like [Copidosoma floridanum]|uniref:E3 ubiquitin-protein ligase MARCH8-like n=1 Tax=Copidosoma floridanum TaxID=29053 RepID=UPI0006C9D56A|nr:E3 ubiquitin-protein ligase MARCH8-like [Copidosoma floridanum]
MKTDPCSALPLGADDSANQRHEFVPCRQLYFNPFSLMNDFTVEPIDERQTAAQQQQQSRLTEAGHELLQEELGPISDDKRPRHHHHYYPQQQQRCPEQEEPEEGAEPTIEESRQSVVTLGSRSVCRICHTDSWAKEPLISPCRCKGTLAHVHLSCLERWLNQSCRNYCELCNFRYEAVETPRYGWFEALRIWIYHPSNRRQIQEDFLIFTLITVFSLGLTSVCLIGYTRAEYLVLDGADVGYTEPWTKAFIILFMIIVILGYATSVYFMIKNLQYLLSVAQTVKSHWEDQKEKVKLKAQRQAGRGLMVI